MSSCLTSPCRSTRTCGSMRLADCGGGRLFSREGGGYSTTTWTRTSTGTSSGRRGGRAGGGGTPLACLLLPVVRVLTWCSGCRLRNCRWHRLLKGEEFLGKLLKTLLKPGENCGSSAVAVLLEVPQIQFIARVCGPSVCTETWDFQLDLAMRGRSSSHR